MPTQGFHYREQELTGRAVADGVTEGAWVDTQGCSRINAYVRAVLFTGTIVVEGSFDGVNSCGTLFTVTVDTLDINGTVCCVPFCRINLTAFTVGTITDAFLHGCV
jgi:hypothetical protein